MFIYCFLGFTNTVISFAVGEKFGLKCIIYVNRTYIFFLFFKMFFRGLSSASVRRLSVVCSVLDARLQEKTYPPLLKPCFGGAGRSPADAD